MLLELVTVSLLPLCIFHCIASTSRSYSGVVCVLAYDDIAVLLLQVEMFQRHPHILVATPGRLLDLVDSSHCRLDSVQTIVLDEADKMLSLGFEPQLERLRSMLLPTADESGAGRAAKRQRKAQASSEHQPQQRKTSQVGAWQVIPCSSIHLVVGHCMEVTECNLPSPNYCVAGKNVHTDNVWLSLQPSSSCAVSPSHLCYMCPERCLCKVHDDQRP